MPVFEADINFHLCIATASQSEILLDLYKTVARNMKEYFSEIYVDTESFIKHAGISRSITAKYYRSRSTKGMGMGRKNNRPASLVSVF